MPSRENLIGGALTVFVVGVVLFNSWDRPGGAPRDLVGTVQSISHRPGDGPPVRLVSLKLASGEVVTAGAAPNLMFAPGDTVRVQRQTRMITNVPSYGIYEVVPKK